MICFGLESRPKIEVHFWITNKIALFGLPANQNSDQEIHFFFFGSALFFKESVIYCNIKRDYFR